MTTLHAARFAPGTRPGGSPSGTPQQTVARRAAARWARAAVRGAVVRGGLVAVLAVAAAGTIRAQAADAIDFPMPAQDQIVPAGAQVELVSATAEFSEGPVPAADGTILFSDIGDRILRYDPSTGETSIYREPSGRANGMMYDRQGRLVVCEGANGGGRRISLTERDGTIRALADRYEGRRFNSPNDLAVSPAGYVYFSDPRYVGDEPRELDFEAVFAIAPDGALRVATRDVQKPNGVLVSPDGTVLYVADNNPGADGARQLLAFQIREDGSLAQRRVLYRFTHTPRGIDGMTLDRDGRIYAAAGRDETSGVYVFDPTGQPLAYIPTPGTPTNCVFGIGDEAQVLYITAAVPPEVAQRGEGPFGLYRIALKTTGYHLYEPQQ